MNCLESTCCICLQKVKNTKLLSESNGGKITYFAKLITSVPEMVFKGMNDEKLICTSCTATLDIVYAFRETCLKSKVVLVEYMEQLFSDETQVEKTNLFSKDISKQLIEHGEMPLEIKIEVLDDEENNDDYVESCNSVKNEDIESGNDCEKRRTHLMLEEYFSDDEDSYAEHFDENETPSDNSSYNKSAKIQKLDVTPSTSSDFINLDLEKVEDKEDPLFLQSICAEETPINTKQIEEQLNWTDSTNFKPNNFAFNSLDIGIKKHTHDSYIFKQPYDYFKLFFSEDILSHIVTETNRYATQTKIARWIPTTPEEIENFFGLLLWMNLNRFPNITDYWQKNILSDNNIKLNLSINRFKLLLNVLHYSNNYSVSKEPNHLQKISVLVKMFRDKFQSLIIPGEELYIDENNVTFNGRASLSKTTKLRHKFNVRLNKLYLKGGYTYDLQLQCLKEDSSGVSTEQVLNLMGELLNSGRTLYTDLRYTNVHLAHELLKRKTYLVGTIDGSKIRYLDKNKELSAKNSDTGVLVLKWKNMYSLSTKHTSELTLCTEENVEKPKLMIDYGNCIIPGRYDQIKSSYCPPLKNIKWYRRLSFVLLGTVVANAYFLYKEITKSGMSVTNFKELILQGMFLPNGPPQNTLSMHQLRDTRKRLRCVVCYHNISNKYGRNKAVSKSPRSKWACLECNKHYCVDCFFQKHNTQPNEVKIFSKK